MQVRRNSFLSFAEIKVFFVAQDSSRKKMAQGSTAGILITIIVALLIFFVLYMIVMAIVNGVLHTNELDRKTKVVY